MSIRFRLSDLDAKLAIPRRVSENSTQWWRTASGEDYQWCFMQTKHLFYCFRMLYDRMATLYNWDRIRPKGQGLESLALPTPATAKLMSDLANEVALRGDLPEPLMVEMAKMMSVLLSKANEQAELAASNKLITAPDWYQ